MLPTWSDELDKSSWIPAGTSTLESLKRIPPKIAFLAPPLDTIPSPSGKSIYVLVEQLSKQLPIPNVVLARWPLNGQPGLSSISSRLLYYDGVIAPTSWEARLPYRIKKLLWGSGFPEWQRYALAAAIAVRQLEVQLLVVEDHPIFCPTIQRIIPNVPLLLHQHNDAPLHFPRRRWAKIISSIASIIFVAHKARQNTIEHHGPLCVPSYVIYNGVDLHHYSAEKWQDAAVVIRSQLGIPRDATVLLFVGRLVPGKGPAEAMQAFLDANVPNTHMLVVGDLDISFGRDESYLDNIRTIAQNSLIHLLGTVSQGILPGYYEASDVVIVPTIQSEGLPKVITEALSMGKPVIASDRGGIWELLSTEYNGWKLNDPTNINEVAMVIRTVLSDKPMLRSRKLMIMERDRLRMGELRMIREFEAAVSGLIGPYNNPADTVQCPEKDSLYSQSTP